jgi:hypothetical protein
MKRNIQNVIVHSLKFPAGEFTHTELARFNGVSNQTVWNRYLTARQTGQIISAGKRKTEKAKGVPSLLWTVNPNFTMALMCVPQPSREVTVTVADVVAASAPVVEVPVVEMAASVDTHAELQAELAAELASA